MPVINKHSRTGARLITSNTPVKSNFSKITKQSAEQKIEFNGLVATYDRLREKTKLTKAEQGKYKDVISTLNSKYGDYLKNVNLEKDAHDKVAKAINNAREALAKKAREMAVYASQKDLMEEIVALESKSMKAAAQRDVIEANIADSRRKANAIDVNASAGAIDYAALHKSQKALNVVKDQERDIVKLTKEENEALAGIAEKRKQLQALIEAHGDKLTETKDTSENINTNVGTQANSLEESEKHSLKIKDNFLKIQPVVLDTTKKIEKIKDKTGEFADASENANNKLYDVKDNWKAMLPDIRLASNALEDGLVNGLADALWNAKSLGDVLQNIGRQLGQMATKDFLGGLVSLLPGGGFFGLAQNIFGFSQGGGI